MHMSDWLLLSVISDHVVFDVMLALCSGCGVLTNLSGYCILMPVCSYGHALVSRAH